MEEIYQKISQLREQELPFDISKKTMGRIMLSRLRLPIFLVGLFTINFIFLCYRVYRFLSATGALSVIKVIINDFEMSWNYISESLDGLIETMPAIEVRLLTINLGLILLGCWYARRIYRANKKLLINS